MPDTGYFDLIFVTLDPESSITGFMSLTATALLITIGFYFKIQRQVLGKMVLIVNMADFVFILTKAIAFLFHPTNDLYCRISTMISHVALMMSFTWGVFFANLLYETSKLCSIDSIPIRFRNYSIISAIISIVLGLGVLFSNYVIYSAELKTCVHRVYFREFDATMTFFAIIPTFVLSSMCVFWYVNGGLNIKRFNPKLNNKPLLTLMLYPAVVIVCYFPGLVTNILIIFEHIPNETVGVILRNLFQLHGVLNALAYGIQPILTALKLREKETIEREDCASDAGQMEVSFIINE